MEKYSYALWDRIRIFTFEINIRSWQELQKQG